MEAHEAVELRTVREGRECSSEMGLGVAVEVSFAGESAPTSEDRESDDLALARGGWWSGALLFGVPRVAKIVDDDVECGEEGCDTKSLERSSSKWTWDSVRSHRHRHMRDWQRTGVKLPGKSKRTPNRAEEPGLGEGWTGERTVNLCKRRHRKIAETRSARQYWIIIGPGTPSCPGVNTYRSRRKEGTHPDRTSPSCATCKPRWSLTGKPTVSRPRGRSKSPAGEGRIEKRMPAAERQGETIARRIGP